MKRFLVMVLAVVMMVVAAGCSDVSENQANEDEAANAEKQSSEVLEEKTTSPETKALANNLENELYLLVGDYINGETTYQEASAEFYKVISKYSDEVLDEVIEVGGIEVFFLVGEDNTNDELILTLYDLLKFHVTGVYEENGTSAGSETAEVPTNKDKGDEDKSTEDDTVLVYSDDYVEIRFSHCEKKYSFSDEWDAVFLIENKTSASLTIGTNYLSINRVSLSDAFGFEEIAPDSIGRFSVSTEEYDGSNLYKISGSFYIADRGKKLGWEYFVYDAEFTVG